MNYLNIPFPGPLARSERQVCINYLNIVTAPPGRAFIKFYSQELVVTRQYFNIGFDLGRTQCFWEVNRQPAFLSIFYNLLSIP